MKLTRYCLLALFCAGMYQIQAQQDTLLLSAGENARDSLLLTSRDSIIVSSWMVSVGINIVDDSGDAFHDFTTMKDQWNMVPFPSRLSIGRYFRSGLGVEAIATYNKYKAGYIIDNSINPEDKDYFGLDSRLSYDLNKLVGETGWFDPYVGVGVGYTHANDVGRGTYNAVIGFRTWFSDHWGLDLSSSGKWSFGTEATNHIQHAAGVVYRFDIKKELSRKGMEKLALIEEQQRVADSIAAARKAEEEAIAMAAALQREKEEAARKAAEEKARQEAMVKRMNDLQSALDSLGHVYFKYDSYDLTDEAKDVLVEVSEIMNANTDVHLKVEGHTDSRGTAQYNQGLSERRAGHVVAYMRDLGVSEDQLHPEGFGESRLLNECADGVRCNAAQHKINRRAEFHIIVN